MAPLIAFKQQAETPNLTGGPAGEQPNQLAVRLLNEGITQGQAAVRAVTDLGPAPDPQAAAGVSSLLATLRDDIKVGQELLPKAQALAPGDYAGLFALAGQGRSQLSTSESSGLSALRTSTGPAMGAALHTTPQCAPLGI